MTTRWVLGQPGKLFSAALVVAAVACSGSDVTGPPSRGIRSAGPTSRTAASLVGLSGRIAFDRSPDTSTYEIYKMSANGTGVTRLTKNRADDFDPAWSPDGKKIAFESQRAGNWEIYVMNADGTAITRLTKNTAKDFRPAWSPDGKKIAFMSTRGSRYNNGYAIYVMSVSGSGVTRLTSLAQCSLFVVICGNTSPAWSPDNKKIVFVHITGYSSSGSTSAVLEIVNADGSSVITIPNTGPNVGVPAWSRTGKIAFVAGNGEGIFVIKPDGSGLTQLTPPGLDDSHPSWSPDGTKIAFSSGRLAVTDPHAGIQIYVMNANGSSVTRVSRNAALQDFDPAWGP
jgi:Tol biopolymer transport system component